MQTEVAEARRGRGPSDSIDRSSPAYRVIYGVFGSQSAFAEETGIPLGSANRYLQQGIIPSHKQAQVIRAAREHSRDLDPALFVPTA